MNVPLIRIVLADDHPMIRESWRIFLESQPGFKVVADCANGQDAIAFTKLHQPDILLVDINMHPINGFEVARQVVSEVPGVRIIGMSVNNRPNYAAKMVELGAHGYLTKTSPIEEIHHGIREVYHGKLYICEEVRKHMPPAE